MATTAKHMNNGKTIANSADFVAEKVTYKLNDMTPFSALITDISGEKINNCYKCKKCSAGCPVTFAMDIPPHQIIKMIQLGMEEKVLRSRTIWLCAACETCGTRCPNEIKLAEMMDALRQRALKLGYDIAEKKISVFHSEFLSSIKKYGRIYEPGMMKQIILKSENIIQYIKNGSFLGDIKLGIKMLSRGKLGVFPQKIHNKKEVRNIFQKTQKG